MNVKKKSANGIVRCINCGYCSAFCPAGAIAYNNQVVTFNKEICKYPVCQNCLNKCPINALEVSK